MISSVGQHVAFISICLPNMHNLLGHHIEGIIDIIRDTINDQYCDVADDTKIDSNGLAAINR